MRRTTITAVLVLLVAGCGNSGGPARSAAPTTTHRAAVTTTTAHVIPELALNLSLIDVGLLETPGGACEGSGQWSGWASGATVKLSSDGETLGLATMTGGKFSDAQHVECDWTVGIPSVPRRRFYTVSVGSTEVTTFDASKISGVEVRIVQDGVAGKVVVVP